jgi:hypothetical protein
LQNSLLLAFFRKLAYPTPLPSYKKVYRVISRRSAWLHSYVSFHNTIRYQNIIVHDLGGIGLLQTR